MYKTPLYEKLLAAALQGCLANNAYSKEHGYEDAEMLGCEAEQYAEILYSMHLQNIALEEEEDRKAKAALLATEQAPPTAQTPPAQQIHNSEIGN